LLPSSGADNDRRLIVYEYARRGRCSRPHDLTSTIPVAGLVALFAAPHRVATALTAAVLLQHYEP